MNTKTGLDVLLCKGDKKIKRVNNETLLAWSDYEVMVADKKEFLRRNGYSEEDLKP